ncbi:MAG: M20/M25/M40 family metallo-hydrolase [Candidatus Nealsonbacteria bacterium DGGOD1a]|nr:MAG: M20/M25/M40 family metallo-hydrolase [Candidatus Nealsonbacteria bacterium DGGOD1a]
MKKETKNLIDLLFKHNTEQGAEKQKYDDNVACLYDVASYLDKHGILSHKQMYSVQLNGQDIPHCNLVAFKPSRSKKYIMLQGHIDTVPVGEKYGYKIKDDKLIGRGAVDMKGPLVGILDAFIKLYNQDTEYAPYLLITCDEEANNFKGIRNYLARPHKKIAFAINGEATNFNFATRMKGVLTFDISKKGVKAGHSSLAKTTIIEKTAYLMNCISRFADFARSIKRTGFGGTVFAFTMFHSGEKENVIPTELKLHFHLRIVEDAKAYLPTFKTIASDALRGYTTKINSIEPVYMRMPDDVRAAMKKAIKINETAYPALAEATVMNQAGIPTVIFGPGEMSRAHRIPKEELIKISDIEKYSETIQKFFKSF